MARNMEALILVINVGPTMHKILPEVENVCALLMEKKLIYCKYDASGVVLFGTKETDNDLTKDVGGYEHVVVRQNIEVVDEKLVDAVQQLPRGTIPGDFLDAVVVGIDMLIKKYGETNKGKKRLCLITDLLSPIKEPYEGTKGDQVSSIAEQMNLQGIKFECTVVVRVELSTDMMKKVINENEQLLNIFATKCGSKMVYVESPAAMLGAIKTRNVMPVTIFRGDLEVSSRLKIKIWVYKKTYKEKFPVLKKFSDENPPRVKFLTQHKVKGFQYGTQVVPISPLVIEAVKFQTEKGVKMLGFTDASNILRHYFVKDVEVLIAEPGNKNAGLAVSALARAMKELNKIGVVRCVYRQGQKTVVIGVLTPNLSTKDNIPDSLYFNVLPFAEDVREFRFPSFSNLPLAFEPTDEQLEAADNLVKSLDLAPIGKEEMLQPELTPNLVLQHFYHFLELKSKNPGAAVPRLDDTLMSITKPDPELISQNKPVIDKFRHCFELMENPKMKKSSKQLRERCSNDNKMNNIGDLTPIKDFEAMLSRRGSSDCVVKAIREMRSKIHDLVEDSYQGSNYNKALECLISLRNCCVAEQEPKQFNGFVQYLSNFCQKVGLADFFELISKEAKPITNEEASCKQMGTSQPPDNNTWLVTGEQSAELPCD